MEKPSLPAGVFFCTIDQATARNPKLQIAIAGLGQARRGDWVRLLVDYPDKDATSGRSFEPVTAMVKEATPELHQRGLLKIRVLSTPERSDIHTIRYGDDILVQQSWIFEHSKSTDDNVRTTRHFLEDMQLVEPQPGKRYWTRDGREAVIWTLMTDAQGAYLLGEVNGQRNIEWLPSGAHRTGLTDFDIVKDPTASEIVREAS